ncbi:flagellin [Candidatus Epulonipiscium viviparus]|uniref:flagellin n=1 Tax=Candidatus Epulonipiscium viviparus TaxID=420336 RepID=UPI00016BFEF4|nr:flagellin [Candidatus Epulopiscium viviparus]
MAINSITGFQSSINNPQNQNINRTRELQREREERNEELSTGKKVNEAADNPAVMAIATKMVSAYIGLNAQSNNIESEMSRSNVADGALSDSQATLSRMNELALQANNGILTDEDRSYIQMEMDQLGEQLGSISKNTEFNTKAVFDEEGIDFSEDTLGSFSVDVTDPNALSQIRGMSSAVSSMQAEVGADYNANESEVRSNNITAENTMAAVSQMQDTDYAESTSAILKNNLLDQYRLQMQSQMQTQMINQMSIML